METAPKSVRLHIALMGRVNSGKSSFLNLVSGQKVAITSPQAGTTTDVVEKTQELLPIGPVVWLDTAGLGDDTLLGEKRQEKTKEIYNRSDVILLVSEGDKTEEYEQAVIEEARSRKIPLIRVFNKADLFPTNRSDGISVTATDLSGRDKVLTALKAELLKVCPDEFINTPPLLGDLATSGGQVIMIVPIDYEAPKGRLILPQVQALRDCLDHDQIVTVVKENGYRRVLESLRCKPDLVVCDSQVVDFMVKHTPKDVPCTTFSILFARLKGDLPKLAAGAAVINNLQDGDKVLIAESCTHHAVEDDIGRVKIPRWLAAKTGKKLQINHVAGHDFPSDLAEYKLVVQCGGCMTNRREVLSRLNCCEKNNVAITNYGVCISELKGVLGRVLEPFPEALQAWRSFQ